jgi:hypothetical protein
VLLLLLQLLLVPLVPAVNPGPEGNDRLIAPTSSSSAWLVAEPSVTAGDEDTPAAAAVLSSAPVAARPANSAALAPKLAAPELVTVIDEPLASGWTLCFEQMAALPRLLLATSVE